MQTRNLGATGLGVSSIGFGCMGLSGGYGAIDEGDAIAVIRFALELGVTLFDTADFYGGGANELLLGRALAGRRNQAVIATKIGVRPDANGRPTVVDGSPAHLKAGCEASLQRLGVTHVDLLLLCRVDPQTPIEDSVGALADLVREGKARHIGLSEASSATIRRAAAVHPIAALETEYSIWERHVERAILPALQTHGIGLMAYSPLGRGVLAGSVSSPAALGERDMRRMQPRFQAENFEQNRARVAEIAKLAGELGVTSAQLCLAWLLARGPGIVPIPGTRSAARLEENVKAAEVVLPSEALARLSKLFDGAEPAGGRYPPAMLASIDRD